MQLKIFIVAALGSVISFSSPKIINAATWQPAPGAIYRTTSPACTRICGSACTTPGQTTTCCGECPFNGCEKYLPAVCTY